MHLLIKRLILSIFAAFGALIVAAHAQETTDEYPYTGIITAKDTNLRAGSNLNYEVVAQLQKGDVVYVAGGWMDWLKVRCPENTLVWVGDGFIDEGLITANKLNVRSGPDLKYNVICQVMKGDKVEVVKKSEDGKWCGIRPPDNAYLWVSKQFVQKKGAADIYDENANRRDNVKRLLAEQEALYETWMKKEATEEVPYDELIAGFESIAKDYSDFTEETVQATRRANQLKSMKKKYQDKLAAKNKTGTAPSGTSTSATTTAATTTTSSGINRDPVVKNTVRDFEPRYVTAKGTLSAAENSAGGFVVYKIIENRKVLCVIKSTSVDLNQYVGKRAQIWGDEEYSAEWSVPFVDVNRVKLIK